MNLDLGHGSGVWYLCKSWSGGWMTLDAKGMNGYDMIMIGMHRRLGAVVYEEKD